MKNDMELTANENYINRNERIDKNVGQNESNGKAIIKTLRNHLLVQTFDKYKNRFQS